LINPFVIDIEDKTPLSLEDYRDIQDKLRQKSLKETLDSLYPKKSPFTWPWKHAFLKDRADFQGRIERGIHQTLIDTSKEQLPKQELIRIHEGGDYCIVSYSSFDGIYPDLIEQIPKALEATAFQGYFLKIVGAFPNPTGKEARYAGVPYAFKLFAMQEAAKLGFSKVLWIDAALLPLRDLTPLFLWIEETGCLLQYQKNGKRYLLPKTRDLLLQETGIDMYNTKSLRARVIGLDFEQHKTQELLADYIHLVDLGTPFCSCFPEEFVLGALLAKTPFVWPQHLFQELVAHEGKKHSQHAFFLLRQH